ncbi:methyltransferase domain-containing protein [Seleniivibrio sp.]|uniref:methyltransferase domain-containing protein n=1 Tax=Seleniivibrio sp. TaxID=2898801 RepID=UPI0025E78E00|nr:methyltransferase domain-containing protein [Seleniivibrio sp.]MCD8554794.1 methyltransferase domain-containing protein [Seleniivibrio sp.]
MKIHIKHAFCFSSESYDSSCDIQRIVAEHLAELLPEGSQDRILEIGTGTGIFTKLLNEKCGGAFCVDIADALLAKAKKNFPENHYICGDGECLPVIGEFSLITGSSALQWFQSPQKSIPDMLKCLKNGGKFAFSVFVEGTFVEMSILNQMTGFGSVYTLPDEDVFAKIFEDCGVSVNKEVCEYVLHFDSVSEFLKKQKGTGATFSGRDSLTSKASYKKFLELYPELFGENEKVPVTYRILYISGQK